MTASLHLT